MPPIWTVSCLEVKSKLTSTGFASEIASLLLFCSETVPVPAMTSSRLPPVTEVPSAVPVWAIFSETRVVTAERLSRPS